MLNIKKCSKCKKVFPRTLQFFNKKTKYKDGLNYWCKKCCKISIAKYRLIAKDKIRAWELKYRKTNKETIRKREIAYYYNNKKRINEASKQYYHKNKAELKKRHKNYRDEYYQKNRDKKIEYGKKYKAKNRLIINKKLVDRKRKNINFRILCNLRSRLGKAIYLSGAYKYDKTKNLIGCSLEDFKKHLESKFQNGMTWDNYGKNGWELDHIIPCVAFDLSKEEEQRKCFHWTNVQPLWRRENASKNKVRTSNLDQKC